MNSLKELNMEELEQVSGGKTFTACVIVGLSTDMTANACVGKGVGTEGEKSGMGANMCAWLGYGIGFSET